MDLIGKFKPSSQGHQCAHMVIDILMNYTWWIPFHTKEAEKVMHTYVVNVYSKLGGSNKILSDNEIEFKDNFSPNVVSTLGIKHASD